MEMGGKKRIKLQKAVQRDQTNFLARQDKINISWFKRKEKEKKLIAFTR